MPMQNMRSNIRAELPLVFVENSRQGENHQVVAIGLAQKTASVISRIALRTFPNMRMHIRRERQGGGDPHIDERRIVEAILSGNLESLLGRGVAGMAPALTAG
jgi:hypothetical protein